MSTCTVTLAVAAAAIALMAATSKTHIRFVWNASESVPIGLYSVQPADRLIVNDLVVAFPPEDLAIFLSERGYLPRHVPLIKRILALPRQLVCRQDFKITVDGIAMGAARERDSRGRLLPDWQGCRPLRQGEVFLMNTNEPASLDGRYFGPLPATVIVGRAMPLWTIEEE